MSAAKPGVILWLSVPLAVLVTVASITGMTDTRLYAAESANWQAQSVGQDQVDLFLVTPVLLISAWLAYRQKKAAIFVWGGTVAYLLYTFIIYCTAVHFNRLFLVYCGALGLSVYSLLWFLYTQFRASAAPVVYRDIPLKVFSIYFIVVSIIFFGLWLSEIIPALEQGRVPASLEETGLITNIVHVLDLSVLLPGLFITGLWAWKKKSAVYPLIPVFLSFFVLMNCTIAALILVMQRRGVAAETGVSIIMGVLALISLVLLVVFISRLKPS